ncbi:ribonuclease Z [Balamuthia mandrillaris]
MPSAYVQVLSNGASGLAPCLLLVIDGRRYLVNCPESIQRFCTEHKLRLGKLEGIFFTEVCWETVGGLTDVLMTVADFGKNDVKLYGPASLYRYLLSTQTFLFRPSLCLDLNTFSGDCNAAFRESVEEGKEEEEDEAELLSFQPLLLSGGRAEAAMVPSQMALAYSCFRSKEEDGEESVMKREGEEERRMQDVVCYAVHTPKLKGKFEMNKAKALGVPPGPLCGRLVKGETITTPSGRTVEPSECIGPSQPGPILLIVSCPSVHHIQALLSDELVNRYHQDGIDGGVVTCVIHLTPLHVLSHPAYIQWVNSFVDRQKNDGNQTPQKRNKKNEAVTQPGIPPIQHVFLHESVLSCKDKALFPSSSKHIAALHSIAPSIYPLPFDLSCSSSDMEEELGLRSLFPNIQFTVGQHLERFSLQPVRSSSITDDTIVNAEENKNENDKNGIEDEAAKVVFLGTVASASNKIRNESGIYVHLDAPCGGGIILDAGSGTYLQMVRQFGYHKTQSLLRNLKCIWITHKHGDHCAGLIQLLTKISSLQSSSSSQQRPYQQQTRMHKCEVCGFRFSFKCSLDLHRAIHSPSLSPSPSQQHSITVPIPSFEYEDEELFLQLAKEAERGDMASELPVLIVGPMWLEPWLVDYAKVEPLHYRFVDAALLHQSGHPFTEYFREACGLKDVRAIRVHHSYPTYAAVLESLQGWKLVYSADTRPCPALIQAGKNATMLIHEATFDEEMKDKAIADSHCTLSEAVTVAQEMEAEMTIFTHFSTRFEAYIPNVWKYINSSLPSSQQSEEEKEKEKEEGRRKYLVAFDFMTVPLLTAQEEEEMLRIIPNDLPRRLLAAFGEAAQSSPQ